MSTSWTALDRNEGPTVWARQQKTNSHTFEIAIGTDPEHPIDTYTLSTNEISRLSTLVKNKAPQ